MNEDQQPIDSQPASADSEEQAQALADLMRGAEEPEQKAAQAQQAQQAAEVAQLHQQMAENAQFLEFAWSVIGGLIPEKIAVRYGPEQRQRIAESGTVLAVKRGWEPAKFFEKWGAEVAFGAALVGPSVPVILEALKNRGKAKPAQVEAQEQGVLGTRVEDGTPVTGTGVNSPVTATFGPIQP